MRKIGILLVIISIIFTVGCSVRATTVAEAINDIGIGKGSTSPRYSLDERFDYFQQFNPNGQGWLHLKCEEGITAIIFNAEENEDGSVKCTLQEIYVVNYGKYQMGYLSTEELIKSVVGDDIEFTLILEDNVVTSKDMPELLPLE